MFAHISVGRLTAWRWPRVMRWCKERGLEVGDTIVLECTGERSLRLSLE